jgi:hypothetical protein
VSCNFTLLFQCACNVDIQLSHQRFEGRPGLGVFDVPFFAIFASRLSSILFADCLLILIHLMTSWIPQMLRIPSRRVLQSDAP